MTKKEICEILDIDNGTLKNWENNRPMLHKVVMSHFNEKNKNLEDSKNQKSMINEITEDLNKLPSKQVKIIYHTIKMKLAELEE